MYDPKSMKAEEFISHEEILDTLAYAQENKSNEKLIDAILERQNCAKAFLTERHLYCWLAKCLIRFSRSMLWQNS